MSKYDSILNIDFKLKHERMTIQNRSFQFAPFSALSGYSELINEKSRETDDKKHLEDDEMLVLNNKLQIIKDNLSSKPIVIVTYFIPDSKKEGGRYEIVKNYIKRIDYKNSLLIFANNLKIKIRDIVDIKSDELHFDDLSL